MKKLIHEIVMFILPKYETHIKCFITDGDNVTTEIYSSEYHNRLKILGHSFFKNCSDYHAKTSDGNDIIAYVIREKKKGWFIPYPHQEQTVMRIYIAFTAGICGVIVGNLILYALGLK